MLTMTNEILIPVLMGVALAAATGLRAFLPLFVLSIAARGGLVQLSPSFDWIESTPALIALGVAVVLEILSDKIPVLDNVLDQIGGYIKPVAATILASSLFTSIDPLFAIVLGIIAGGVPAAAVHSAKSAIRLGSTAFTFGSGNFFLSILDDLFSFLGSIIGVLAPFLAAALAIVIIAIIWRVRKRKKLKLASLSSSCENMGEDFPGDFR